MMTSIRSRFNIHPLQQTHRQISEWFETPLGLRLLDHERSAVAEELQYLFGYHFMQLSSIDNADFSSLSRINHCFSLTPDATLPANETMVRGVADFDQLPFEDDVIDVTVLHHVLEFSENPHQVLKEAARVTIPRGYIIIVAFNPLSLAGVFQPLGALFNLSGISRRRPLRASRLRDWLEFLDFSASASRYVFHNLPINNARYLSSTRFLERFRHKHNLPMGMSVVMVARKDKVGLTPIKPKWERSGLLGSIPIAKQAIRVQASKECLILPFRTRIK